MTLIIGVLTDQYVALASDRRITLTRGTATLRQDDVGQKTFVINDSMIMGFTGVAYFRGVPMEDWIGKYLEGANTGDILNNLRAGVSAEFRRLNLSRFAQAFLAVGFTASRADITPRPTLMVVSNFLQPDGALTARGVRDEFATGMTKLGNRRQYIQSVGEAVPPALRTRTLQHVRWALKADPLDPFLIHDILVETIRDVSRTSSGRVGESVMFTSMPLVDLGRGGVTVQLDGRPDKLLRREETYATYSQRNFKGPGANLMYAPAVFQKNVQMSGIVGGFLPAGQWLGPRPPWPPT